MYVSTDLVPAEHWDIPPWINLHLYQESVALLTAQKVQFMNKPSYHQMCRWNSGLFSQHPALAHIQYYWRVEPNVHFFCDVDYDVFRWMSDHNKTYGFNINIYDNPDSVTTLWPETLRFLKDHPGYEAAGNARQWLEAPGKRVGNNDTANGYSTCHFWSNFEIGDMGFWRSAKYREYFDHLDRAGGFFYERWGDAPVHSIALGLFEDKRKIHWYALHSCMAHVVHPVLTESSGSATSAINTSPSSTAPTAPNAAAANRASSPTAKSGSTAKTAVPHISSTSAWTSRSRPIAAMNISW